MSESKAAKQVKAGPWTDAQQMAKAHPEDFDAPSVKEIRALAAGCLVKISGAGVECWVSLTKVEANQEQPFLGKLWGKIDSASGQAHKRAPLLQFEGRHVWMVSH